MCGKRGSGFADHPGAGHRFAFVERYILRQAAHPRWRNWRPNASLNPTASFIVILYAGLVALRPGGISQHLDVGPRSALASRGRLEGQGEGRRARRTPRWAASTTSEGDALAGDFIHAAL